MTELYGPDAPADISKSPAFRIQFSDDCVWLSDMRGGVEPRTDIHLTRGQAAQIAAAICAGLVYPDYQQNIE